MGPEKRGRPQEAPDPYRIKKMPTRTELQDFLRGMSGPVGVVFDGKKGVFERIIPVEEYRKLSTRTLQARQEFGDILD